MRVLLDTNVLFSALYSSSGMSYKLVNLIEARRFTPVVWVTLLLEYEAVLKRKIHEFEHAEIDKFLDNIMSWSHLTKRYYLSRPMLSDADDDMVLEAAISGSARYIVTHNLKDFKSIEKWYNIEVITPKDFYGKLQG